VGSFCIACTIHRLVEAGERHQRIGDRWLECQSAQDGKPFEIGQLSLCELPSRGEEMTKSEPGVTFGQRVPGIYGQIERLFEQWLAVAASLPKKYIAQKLQGSSQLIRSVRTFGYPS
jgi:hypothetical protein